MAEAADRQASINANRLATTAVTNLPLREIRAHSGCLCYLAVQIREHQRMCASVKRETSRSRVKAGKFCRANACFIFRKFLRSYVPGMIIRESKSQISKKTGVCFVHSGLPPTRSQISVFRRRNRSMSGTRSRGIGAHPACSRHDHECDIHACSVVARDDRSPPVACLY